MKQFSKAENPWGIVYTKDEGDNTIQEYAVVTNESATHMKIQGRIPMNCVCFSCMSLGDLEYLRAVINDIYEIRKK